MRPTLPISAGLTMVLIACGPLVAQERGPGWARHIIDGSSRGADGVRLADANGDGLPDIATGWEEGGKVRVYLNPGPAEAKSTWPAVTVGAVGSPEDAVLVDLDGDGALDVVSCCEGKTRSVFVHWAPGDRGRYLDSGAWRTGAVPAAAGRMWMFCLPMQVDGHRGIDLIVGSKNRGAQIGWLESPESPRDLAAWRWHPLRDAGWVMSLAAADMDRDGDQDVVATDRRGPGRGCFWLENPGPEAAATRVWAEHPIGASGLEPMFLKIADLDRDGRLDVLVAARERGILLFRRSPENPEAWESSTIGLPPRTGVAKAPAVGDIDADGKPDLVFSCEQAPRGSGVLWMSPRRGATGGAWDAHEVAGSGGVKYDLVELLDLDGDGDLDVLTCEERDNLGVIWYENPTRSQPR